MRWGWGKTQGWDEGTADITNVGTQEWSKAKDIWHTSELRGYTEAGPYMLIFFNLAPTYPTTAPPPNGYQIKKFIVWWEIKSHINQGLEM